MLTKISHYFVETYNYTTIDIQRERGKFSTIFPKWKACNIMHEYDKNGLVLSWAVNVFRQESHRI